MRCLLRLYEASANGSRWLDNAKRARREEAGAFSMAGSRVTSGDGSNAQNAAAGETGLVERNTARGTLVRWRCRRCPCRRAAAKLAGKVLNDVVSLLASTL